MSDSGNQAPWYAAGLKFTCTQCGRCCGGAPGYVWVSDEEIDALAAHLNISREECASLHTRKAGRRRSLREQQNGDCAFLRRDPDGKARCSIYKARPLQCRTWPFWTSNIETAANWAVAAEGCPGMNKGQHHALPVIQAALQQNAAAALPL